MSPTSHSSWGKRSRQRDQGRGGVDANDVQARLDAVAGDRLTHPAADIQNGAGRSDVAQEAVEPPLLLQRPVAIAIERAGVPLVEIDDSRVAHKAYWLWAIGNWLL